MCLKWLTTVVVSHFIMLMNNLPRENWDGGVKFEPAEWLRLGSISTDLPSTTFAFSCSSPINCWACEASPPTELLSIL